MRIRLAALVGLLGLLAVPEPAAAIQAICKNCGRPFEYPDWPADQRATNPGRGAGNPRLRGPCCYPRDDRGDDRGDCDRLQRRYREKIKELRDEWQKLDDRRKAGTITPAQEARALALSGDMEYYEQLLKNLGEICGGGKPGDGSGADRMRRDAATGATAYDRLGQQDREALDVIQGFFGSGAALPGGFNGERAEITRGYRQIAADLHRAAELLSAEPGKPPVRPDPKEVGDYREVIKVPKRLLDLKKDDPAARLLAGAAVEARLRANDYMSAYAKSMLRLLAARAAGDDPGVRRQAAAMTEFAYLAGQYGETAARKEYAYNQQHLVKTLDGLTGAELAAQLSKMQAALKEGALPPALAEALRHVNASDAELKSSRDRLMALKPADVTKFVAQYKARSSLYWVQAPDGVLAELLLCSARLAAQPAK